MPPKRVLSALEWVGVAVSVVQASMKPHFTISILSTRERDNINKEIVSRLAIAAVAAIFQRSEGPSTYYRHFCYAGSRILTGSLSSRALAYIPPSV